MRLLRFFWRVAERYLRGHRTGVAEVALDYDRAADTYGETWQAFMEPVNRGFLDRLALPPEGRVLDLGCGTGLVLGHLRARGFQGGYVGVDASRGMLSRVPADAGAELHLGDAEVLLEGLPSAAFDGVTALWSWEYLDRKRMLPQLRRVLRPGGQVLLLANRRDTLPELEAAFLRLMAERPEAIRKVYALALRMPHSAAQMARELRRAGFGVTHVQADERVQRHGTAEAAVAWGFRTGALAGTRCVLELPDLDAQLARMLERSRSTMDAFTTTHRYAGVMGTFPC